MQGVSVGIHGQLPGEDHEPLDFAQLVGLNEPEGVLPLFTAALEEDVGTSEVR